MKETEARIKTGEARERRAARDMYSKFYAYALHQVSLIKNERVFFILCNFLGDGIYEAENRKKAYALDKDGNVIPVIMQKTGNGIRDGLAMSMLDGKYAESVLNKAGRGKKFRQYYYTAPKVNVNSCADRLSESIEVIKKYGKEYRFCGPYPVLEE